MSIGYVKRDKLLATVQYAAMLSGTLSNALNHTIPCTQCSAAHVQEFETYS
jgi:hypothetical protein